MKLDSMIFLILIWALDDATPLENGNLTVYKEPEKGSEKLVNLHSRRKRYIVFPKGSSLQLLLELLVHVPTQFRVVVGPTLQVAWPLPSETFKPTRTPAGENPNVKRHFQNFLKLKKTPARKTSTGEKFVMFSNIAALMDLFGMTVGLAWQLPDDPMIHLDFKKKHKMYKRNVFKKMEAFMRPGGANGRQCVLRALCESGQRTPSKKGFLKEILHKIFSVDAEEEGELEESQEDKLYRKAHQSVNQNCETLYPECHFSLFNTKE